VSELDRFVGRVVALRADLGDGERLVAEVKEELVPLLQRSWLPPQLLDEQAQIPVRYLLHRSDAVTVFAILSPPGFVSSIHDHGSWGVVGQVTGVEREVVYEMHAEAEVGGPGLVGLRQTTSTELAAGDIVAIVPPHRDLHEVRTLGSTPSLSIHAFGRDPLQGGFAYFEPRLYEPFRYSGLWDNEPPGALPGEDGHPPHG